MTVFHLYGTARQWRWAFVFGALFLASPLVRADVTCKKVGAPVCQKEKEVSEEVDGEVDIMVDEEVDDLSKPIYPWHCKSGYHTDTKKCDGGWIKKYKQKKSGKKVAKKGPGKVKATKKVKDETCLFPQKVSCGTPPNQKEGFVDQTKDGPSIAGSDTDITFPGSQLTLYLDQTGKGLSNTFSGAPDLTGCNQAQNSGGKPAEVSVIPVKVDGCKQQTVQLCVYAEFCGEKKSWRGCFRRDPKCPTYDECAKLKDLESHEANGGTPLGNARFLDVLPVDQLPKEDQMGKKAEKFAVRFRPDTAGIISFDPGKAFPGCTAKPVNLCMGNIEGLVRKPSKKVPAEDIEKFTSDLTKYDHMSIGNMRTVCKASDDLKCQEIGPCYNDPDEQLNGEDFACALPNGQPCVTGGGVNSPQPKAGGGG